jgi:hypothetical protein
VNSFLIFKVSFLNKKYACCFRPGDYGQWKDSHVFPVEEHSDVGTDQAYFSLSYLILWHECMGRDTVRSVRHCLHFRQNCCLYSHCRSTLDPAVSSETSVPIYQKSVHEHRTAVCCCGINCTDINSWEKKKVQTFGVFYRNRFTL